MRESLDGGDFVSALAELAARRGHQALGAHELGLAVRLATAAAQFALSPPTLAALHLPNGEGVMTPAGRLVYDDAPWLSASVQVKSYSLKHGFL